MAAGCGVETEGAVVTIPDKLTTRPPRVIPAVLLAVLAVAFGGVGIWLFGVRQFDGNWPPQASATLHTLATVPFGSTAVFAASIAVLVVGVVFMCCGLIPGDPSNREVLPLEAPGQTVMARRDIARQIKREVELIDGVGSAQVSLQRRALDVSVGTPIDAVDAIKQRTKVVVDQQLEQLHPTTTIRPRIRVRHVR